MSKSNTAFLKIHLGQCRYISICGVVIANLTCAWPSTGMGWGWGGAQDPALEMQATLCDLTTAFVVVV